MSVCISGCQAYSEGMKQQCSHTLLKSTTSASALRDEKVRATYQRLSTVTLILLLVAFGLPASADARHADSNGALGATLGTLKVWVPAGMIGGDYWIYLNGRLRSAPPHGPADPRSRSIVTIDIGSDSRDPKIKYGWDLLTRDGLVLRIRHEEYDSLLTRYLNAPAGDTLDIFQIVEFALPAGQYTVEVVILSRTAPDGVYVSLRSFPFVITKTSVAEVRAGQTTPLYPGVPDDWIDYARQDTILLAPRGICKGGSAPPDLKEFRRSVQAYLLDPMVKILRGLDFPSLSRSKGVVTLDLPPAQGGSREFDGRQIKFIAEGTLAEHYLPSHSDVTSCRRRFPQFSESYAEFDKLIGLIEDDRESLRKLGGGP